MKKLVVIAEAEEMKLVKKLGYGHRPVLITGVGAMNVIDALKDIPRDTEIVNIGYAGSKDLEIGKFYAVSQVGLYHPNVEYNEKLQDIPYIGRIDQETILERKKCLTSTDFVTQTEENDCLFDMELAYIRALGFEHIISYKFVSDNLDLQEHKENMIDNIVKGFVENGLVDAKQ